MQVAPFRMASGINRDPSSVVPGMAINKSPLFTNLLSRVICAMVCSRSPRNCRTFTPCDMYSRDFNLLPVRLCVKRSLVFVWNNSLSSFIPDRFGYTVHGQVNQLARIDGEPFRRRLHPLSAPHFQEDRSHPEGPYPRRWAPDFGEECD